jgi:hypothetical protein
MLNYDNSDFLIRSPDTDWWNPRAMRDPTIPDIDMTFGLDSMMFLANKLADDSDILNASLRFGQSNFPDLMDLPELQKYVLPNRPSLPEFSHPDFGGLNPDIIGGEYVMDGYLNGGFRTIRTISAGELIWTDNPRLIFELVMVLLNSGAGSDDIDISIVTEHVVKRELENSVVISRPLSQFRWYMDGSLIATTTSRYLSLVFPSAGSYSLTAFQLMEITRADRLEVEEQEYWVWTNSPIGPLIIYNSRVKTMRIDSNHSDPTLEWQETNTNHINVSAHQAGMVFVVTPNGAATSGGQTHATQRAPIR